MTRGIRVKNTDDIQKINKIVTKYPYDIWIHGKSGMVDAKSLLGMFLLSLNEPLQIVLEDDVDATAIWLTTWRSTTSNPVHLYSKGCKSHKNSSGI